jgi:general secretion pathway protein B
MWMPQWQENDMSYILDALKKAQAERQLGTVPTLDAAPIYGGAGPASPNPWLILALLVLGLLLGVLLWREMMAPVAGIGAPAAIALPEVPKAEAPNNEASNAQAHETKVAAKVDTKADTEVATKVVTKVAATPKTADVAKATAKAAEAAPVPAPAPAAPAAPAAATSVARAQSPAPSAATEAGVPLLRELPEPIQRQIPAIAIGGYIYSKNPADRLLLIDKALRREGDELAPGLMLEKLQPTSAIFSYRGYRYLVPY